MWDTKAAVNKLADQRRNEFRELGNSTLIHYISILLHILQNMTQVENITYYKSLFVHE